MYGIHLGVGSRWGWVCTRTSGEYRGRDDAKRQNRKQRISTKPFRQPPHVSYLAVVSRLGQNRPWRYCRSSRLDVPIVFFFSFRTCKTFPSAGYSHETTCRILPRRTHAPYCNFCSKRWQCTIRVQPNSRYNRTFELIEGFLLFIMKKKKTRYPIFSAYTRKYLSSLFISLLSCPKYKTPC